jgi:hypothetical protein
MPDGGLSELFPDLDLGSPPGNSGCARPIGRRTGRAPRRPRAPRGPNLTRQIVVLVTELGADERHRHRQHARDLDRLTDALRDLAADLECALRGIAEIRRALDLTALHQPPRATRRRPLGSS